MSVAIQVMIANFNSPDGAKNAFHMVKKEKLKRGEVAILTKNENGKIKIKQIHDRDFSRVMKRGVAAGLVGSLLTPVVGSAAGVVIGVLMVDKVIDTGFPNDKLKTMAKSLQPSHSMIVIITDLESAPIAKHILTQTGGQFISHSLDAELVAELEQAVISKEVKADASEQE